MDDIHIIILAAGLSRRMGDVNKLLLDIDGAPMVRRAAELYSSIFSSVTLVSGYEAGKIERAVEGINLNILHNPDFTQGQQSSVRCGLRSIPDSCEAVFIALADQPFLTPQDISDFTMAFMDSPRDKIFIPYHHEQRGNPVIFPARLLRSVDETPRAFIDAHPDRVHRYRVSNDHFTTDIDRPQDVKGLGENACHKPLSGRK